MADPSACWPVRPWIIEQQYRFTLWPRPGTRRTAGEYFLPTAHNCWPISSHWQFTISRGPIGRATGLVYCTSHDGLVVFYTYCLSSSGLSTPLVCGVFTRQEVIEGIGSPTTQEVKIYLPLLEGGWSEQDAYIVVRPTEGLGWWPRSEVFAFEDALITMLPTDQFQPDPGSYRLPFTPENGPDDDRIPWPPFDAPFVLPPP